MTLKSKIEVLTSALEFDEVCKFNKNFNIMLMSRLISSLAATASSLRKYADQMMK
jgi:hypothetical protein